MWIHFTDAETALLQEALRGNCTDKLGQENDHDRLFDKVEAAAARQREPEAILISGTIVYGEECSEIQSVAFERFDALTDGNINYDANSIMCRTDDGAYVMGWIYVSNMEIENVDQS
ncbi:hypothetical protein HJA82_29505 [Rhizobium bangladeshense]|uniref:gamma-glutamylcyclotransferase n=1 Tax=Rhizobium bangladeshense TaxID=1138189 RepID=UPI001C838AD5|nr:gamma-glutamylcyclotransferase [Rhizobium bangladeshense]MBX4911453.1 hypothetical protein [Rhizobium bangladeshense]